jgi:hypothetical protein
MGHLVVRLCFHSLVFIISVKIEQTQTFVEQHFFLFFLVLRRVLLFQLLYKCYLLFSKIFCRLIKFFVPLFFFLLKTIQFPSTCWPVKILKSVAVWVLNFDCINNLVCFGKHCLWELGSLLLTWLLTTVLFSRSGALLHLRYHSLLIGFQLCIHLEQIQWWLGK